MPEYVRPGVHVQEVASGVRPIEGVGTSTAGFVGPTERGPTLPRLVTSWAEFIRWFGDTTDPAISFMPFSVRGFFENGGRRAFIARIAGEGARTATADLQFLGAVLRLTANGPGVWGNRVLVRISPASQNAAPPASWFRLTVAYYAGAIPPVFVDPLNPADWSVRLRREPDVLEEYDNLASSPDASNFIERIVNPASALVQVACINTRGSAKRARQKGRDFDPGVTFVDLAGGGAAQALTGGTAGATPIAADYVGTGDVAPDRRIGLAGLATIDELSLLVAPDEVNGAIANGSRITAALVEQCELLRDRFAILSVRADQRPVHGILPPHDTTYGAVYFPWIRVADTRTQDTLLVPASGHVAGIYARSDIERAVHKAPANELVRGIVEQDPAPALEPLEYRVTSAEGEILNARGVNVIRDFRAEGRGIRVWGARTMSSDPLLKYVNVRRLLLFVEESIDAGTQWAVFEPNDEPLWSRIRQAIANFLTTVWRSGALQGAKADEAFFVRCGRDTMTQDDIDNGRLIGTIGVAPVKPAEFVVVRIHQKTLESQR
jgi:phage tail sheath protein FI